MRLLSEHELLRIVAADDGGGNVGPDTSGPFGGGGPVGDIGGLLPLLPVLPVIHNLPIG